MRTCLIVDDSRVVRKVASRIVTELGFAPLEAEHGQDALAVCASAMPDVILLDWNMPVMDGLAFLKALRAQEGVPQPPVVFCTTENDISHIQQAMEAGANEYIMKPFDAAILRGKFAQIGLVDQ